MRSLKLVGGIALLAVSRSAMTASECDPYIKTQLERGLVKTESSGNPYAIGVVGGRLVRQPHNLDEAVATAISLEAQGFNFSVGCRQVNKSNFRRYGLTIQTAFDPEANSQAGTDLHGECLERAISKFGKGSAAERAALSCYYSGNFTSGQRKEGNQSSYVDKVLSNASQMRTSALAIPVIPAKPKAAKKAEASDTASATSTVPKAVQHAADWDVFKEL